MNILTRFGLKQLNFFLICLILTVNGYVLVSPVLPRLDLWRRKHQSAAVAGLPYKTKLDIKSGAVSKRAPIPTDDRLVIPKIALNQHIYEGNHAYLVNLGVWARPNSSTPPNGSNTVLVAHRFTYLGPATFYSLGSLSVGDSVVVYWQGKEYDYTVNSNKIVDATDLAVENSSANSKLTLYTCTPLWTANPQSRIVVTASLNGRLND